MGFVSGPMEAMLRGEVASSGAGGMAVIEVLTET